MVQGYIVCRFCELTSSGAGPGGTYRHIGVRTQTCRHQSAALLMGGVSPGLDACFRKAVRAESLLPTKFYESVKLYQLYNQIVILSSRDPPVTINNGSCSRV